MRKYGNNPANYLSGSGLACMASKEQTLQAFNFKSNLQTTPSICQPFAKHQYNRKCWSAATTAAASGAATTGELYFRFLILRKSGKSRWVSYCLQWFNEFFFPIPQQQQQTQFIRATQSAPGTPAKLTHGGEKLVKIVRFLSKQTDFQLTQKLVKWQCLHLVMRWFDKICHFQTLACIRFHSDVLTRFSPSCNRVDGRHQGSATRRHASRP